MPPRDSTGWVEPVFCPQVQGKQGWNNDREVTEVIDSTPSQVTRQEGELNCAQEIPMSVWIASGRLEPQSLERLLVHPSNSSKEEEMGCLLPVNRQSPWQLAPSDHEEAKTPAEGPDAHWVSFPSSQTATSPILLLSFLLEASCYPGH